MGKNRPQCQLDFKSKNAVIQAFRDIISLGQKMDYGDGVTVEDQMYKLKKQCEEHGYGKPEITDMVEKACTRTVWEVHLPKTIRGKNKK